LSRVSFSPSTVDKVERAVVAALEIIRAAASACDSPLIEGCATITFGNPVADAIRGIEPIRSTDSRRSIRLQRERAKEIGQTTSKWIEVPVYGFNKTLDVLNHVEAATTQVD
jgi:hypothetical protein